MSEPQIDFSLVITNYNRARFIDRAIRSCLMQLVFRRSIEVIVVDDHSTDNSLDILQEFARDVRLFVNDVNRGVAHASNLALTNARGRYWMRVDADDFLNMYACAFMAGILDENEDIDFVYCDHFRVDVRGVKISKVRLDTESALFDHGAGILFRTEKLREIGGYDESLRNCEDYDLLLRLKKSGGKGHYLPVPLYRYYIHGENITLSDERQAFRRIVEAKHGI
jgi:glycosyltransferase involved in cell wall biosynthesis